MSRSIVIVFAGVFVALAAYCAIYFGGTASRRDALESRTPELLWLKKEFNLSETEFKRISALHENYLPECKEMARRIDQTNAELKQLLSSSGTLTPQIERALTEAAQMRVECHKMMLRHFYEVARSMPPEQGKRYLAWVQEQTFHPQYGTCPAHQP